MSVSIGLLLSDYTSLEALASKFNHVLNIHLIDVQLESERYFYSYLSGGQYFSLGYQDHLENDRDIDFENFKYIISIYLNKIESFDSQVEAFSDLFKSTFAVLKNKYKNNLKGLIVYDTQALISRLD